MECICLYMPPNANPHGNDVKQTDHYTVRINQVQRKAAQFVNNDYQIYLKHQSHIVDFFGRAVQM